MRSPNNEYILIDWFAHTEYVRWNNPERNWLVAKWSTHPSHPLRTGHGRRFRKARKVWPTQSLNRNLPNNNLSSVNPIKEHNIPRNLLTLHMTRRFLSKTRLLPSTNSNNNWITWLVKTLSSKLVKRFTFLSYWNYRKGSKGSMKNLWTCRSFTMNFSMFTSKKRRKLLNVSFYDIKWTWELEKPKGAE